MSWLRRLSRDRNNSKGESDFQGQKSMSNYRPASSYNETQTFPLKDSQFSSTHNSQDMLASYRRSAPMDQTYVSPSHLPNASSDATMHTAPLNNMAQIPDPLTRAFNEAIKPYLEQIELLKNDLEDAHQQIQQYESERADMHAWIDKRGLRPDLTPRLAATMSSSPIAASTFSSQLERKMTMLNYDLHRLADSLPSPIPMSTVTSTLATLLPSIAHLSTLSQGAPLAFELLIKLAGNLNSHNTEGEESESDSRTIAEFYTRLDESMVDVIRRRLEQSNAGEENPEWKITRDVKRLENTGDFLRKEMNLGNYFVRSLEVLRYEIKRGGEGMTRYSP